MSTTAILQTLVQLEQLHSSLLQLAVDKMEILKQGDMEKLDGLLKDEQAHVAAIVQMENKRQQSVVGYLASKGQSSLENATITEVIKWADSIDEQQALQAARDSLLETIHQLKQQNDLNQKLTMQSLQLVNISLDAIRPRPEQATYTRPDQDRKKPSEGFSTFDSQA
ncbi:flagellar protein FlgN [Sporosarcina sp. HYO08]|uniref:flagellar protein FlgN n=1 Tax=Sporosarcina sp. HYO08 TaxID=1759557 RepID=UPI00079B3F4F|nr:flagellar protein FlgN [Sporosarcina sp. HYO08]KXH84136.1 hypothetical protein AU377_05175 [Sporosarcina sp. HYO08]